MQLAQPAPLGEGFLSAVDPGQKGLQGALAAAPGVGTEDGVLVHPGAHGGVADLQGERGGQHEQLADLPDHVPQDAVRGRGLGPGACQVSSLACLHTSHDASGILMMPVVTAVKHVVTVSGVASPGRAAVARSEWVRPEHPTAT